MLEDISWLDIGAGALILYMSVSGAVRGAVRTMLSLVAIVVGASLAGHYGHLVGAETWPVVSDMEDARTAGVVVGCAVIFAATLLAGVLAGRLLRRLIEGADLGALDRALGFLIGAAKGGLIAAVATVGLLAVNVPSMEQAAEGTVTLQATQRLYDLTRDRLPADAARWIEEQLAPQRPDGGAPR